MFRMWGKVFADNHLLKDFVVENPSLDMTRTKNIVNHKQGRLIILPV